MEQPKVAIAAQGLKKKFAKKWALDGFDCQMEEGHIYGLLGRNGAGKSTFLRIATAQIAATSGQVRIDGQTPTENANALGQICMISDVPEFGGLTRVRDVIAMYKEMYTTWDDDLARRLANAFELDVRRKTKGLSRGMQTAVGLLCGLASQAPITIFDEPSLGLDAVIRERFYDEVIDSYEQNPRTIILSTHLIDEVARILEYAVMIDDGRLVLQDSVEDLLARAVCVSGFKDDVGAKTDRLNVLRTETFAGRVSRYVFMEKGETPSFGGDLRVDPISLQRLFVLLTEKEHDYVEGGL